MNREILTTGEPPEYIGVKSREGRFPVMEIFGPTLQGEGNVIGMRTHFIRFGGCDFRCKMCDSMHAVDPKLVHENAKWMNWQEILRSIGDLDIAPMVTLSGGNPCIWNLTDIVLSLRDVNFRIAVETQGTMIRPWLQHCNYITISPKGPGMGEECDIQKFRSFYDYTNKPHLHQSIKVVIFSKEDIDFAKYLHREFDLGAKLFLSLGNPSPPRSWINEQGDYREEDWLRKQLLDKMCMLWELICKEPDLRGARFLPQLHVLMYGNKREV